MPWSWFHSPSSCPGHTRSSVTLRSPVRARASLVWAGACLGIGMGTAGCGQLDEAVEAMKEDKVTSSDSTGVRKWVLSRKGTLVTVHTEDGSWVATYTRGARLVNLTGPKRTFAESSARHSVTHTTWVRPLPAAFDGRFNPAWLERALAANAKRVPDLLAVGMEYVEGAPARFDSSGRQYAGDAQYGPLDEATGTRLEGSDVEDYLQTKSGVGARTREALDPARRLSLDCSGFIRMILGYRSSFPDAGYEARFALERAAKGTASPTAESPLPRTAEELYTAGRGVVIVADKGVQAAAFDALLPGDLVFFQAENPPVRTIDHVGLFLGRDAAGRWRFLSSRKSANGPTLGDTRGMSVLDGSGLYARAFRAARRY